MRESVVAQAFAAAALCVCFPTLASGATETFGFTRIATYGHGASEETASNLRVDVSNDGLASNQVSFRFYWTGTPAGILTEIYLDDGLPGCLQELVHVDDSDDGVNFNNGGYARPWELPGGYSFMMDDEGPFQFETTRGFLTESRRRSRFNGVQYGESVSLIFDMADGFGFDDIVGAMNAGWGEDVDGDGRIENSLKGLVIGVHVRGGYRECWQESYITVGHGGTLIPLPMTFGLGVAGLTPLAIRRRRTL
ncbi:MAG: hypothetical protein ACF8GE_12265 [Phycisphaerales bacterium JB043]